MWEVSAGFLSYPRPHKASRVIAQRCEHPCADGPGGLEIPVTATGILPTRCLMKARPEDDDLPPLGPAAAGSGPNTKFTDAEQVALAEQALARQEWPAARELWHQLACAHPQSRPYRAQLTFARAGELLAAGEAQRAREELDRVLRLVPNHPGAVAMMKAVRRGRLSRLLRLS